MGLGLGLGVPSVTMTKLTNLAVIEPMAEGRPMPG